MIDPAKSPPDRVPRSTCVPGENLTRAEARERAAVVAHRVVRRHPRPHDRADDVRVPHRGAVHARPPGRATFIDLIAPTVHEVTLNGRVAGRRRRSSPTRGSQLDGLAASNELVVVADAAYMNTGEGLHRFVDPVDDEVYLYSQFEVADSRRVFAVFEQPDLKADVHVHRDRAGALDRRVQLPAGRHARRRRGRHQPQRRRRQGHRDLDVRDHAAHLVVHHRDHRRAVPRASTASSRARTAASSRSASTAAGRWPSTWTPTTSSTSRAPGFDVLRARVRRPVPVRQVRPALRARSSTPAPWRTPAR